MTLGYVSILYVKDCFSKDAISMHVKTTTVTVDKVRNDDGKYITAIIEMTNKNEGIFLKIFFIDALF